MSVVDVLYVGVDAGSAGGLIDTDARGCEKTEVSVHLVPPSGSVTTRLRRGRYNALVFHQSRPGDEEIDLLRDVRDITPALPVFFRPIVPDEVIRAAREHYETGRTIPGDSLGDAADQVPSNRRALVSGTVPAGRNLIHAGDPGTAPSVFADRNEIESIRRPEERETGGRLSDPTVLEPRFVGEVLNDLQDIFFVFDLEMNFLYWNDRLNELTGCSDTELVSMEPLDLIAEEHHERAREKISEVLAVGEATAEFDLVGSDGRHVPHEFTGSLIRADDGESQYICGVGRDVTALREREAELREQRDLVNQILETSPVAMAFLDEDGSVVRLNRHAEDIFDLDRDDLNEQSRDLRSWDFVDESGEHLFEDEHPVERVLETGEPVFQVTHKLGISDDSDQWFSSSAAPLFDDDDDVNGAVVVMKDITDLKEKQRSLEERTAELDTANEELRRSNTELEQFAYVVSHDLKEPLRMVSSYLGLLERRYAGELDEDADGFIEFAVDGAERMQQRVDDLLRYSRVGRGEESFEPVDCNQVLETVLSNLSIAIEDADAEVTVGSLPTVVGDESQLDQLFQNLVSNAIKHADGPEPHVCIDAERDGEEWVISVADNGPGIPPEKVDRVFDLFYSGDDSGATGIGLAICEKIVSRHDGAIRVESDPGEGATFSVSLPVADDEQPC